MDVSVIIPARNEEFLQQTIDSVLSAAKAETEVIAILDGYWPSPGIQDNPRVTLIHHNEPVGQRGGINEAAMISKAKYILKTDAHSMFDEGFDVKLMADCEYDWTVIPRMYNLDAFHWVCLKPSCGHEHHQGTDPGKCDVCGYEKLGYRFIWQPKWKKKTDYMFIDTDLRAKYWQKYRKRGDNNKKKIDEVMNGQGACWFMHRDRFWDLGGMDNEGHGSWGQMGVEVACKAWLSGGKHIVNKKTWFSHLFRTQKGFGFPYHQSGRAVENARAYSRDLWLNNKWPMQKHKFMWLIDKFAPVPTWEENGDGKT